MSQSSDAREEMEPTATRSSETPTQEINEESPPLFSGSTRASNKRAGSSNETDEPRPKVCMYSKQTASLSGFLPEFINQVMRKWVPSVCALLGHIL